MAAAAHDLPAWQRLTDGDLAELVGSEVDASRGEGFRAPPEPIQMLVYDVRWVVAFPRPRPFREPTCMPSDGPSRLQRIGRQLIPRRNPQGCCWYHAGDWTAVSQEAAYINGQHRARAMLDQGVHRTVTVRVWEEMPD